MPAHSASMLRLGPGLERGSRAPVDDRVDPALVEPAVDAAELHRAADPDPVAVGRAADVHVGEQDRVRRHHARADVEAVALARPPSAARRRPSAPARSSTRPAASTTMSASMSPAGRAHRRQPPALAHQLDHLGALADLDAVAAQHRGEARRERVGRTCQCSRISEPGGHSIGQRGLELVQLGAGDDVVGQRRSRARASAAGLRSSARASSGRGRRTPCPACGARTRRRRRASPR